MDSPLFLIAIAVTGVGILGATIIAPLVAAWWARSSAPAWSAATAVLAVLLVVAIIADRALAGADSGKAVVAALPGIAATLLAVGPIVTSTLALASSRRSGREIPRPLFVTYLIPLGVFCVGLALYVAAGVRALSSGPAVGPVPSAIGVIAVWVAGVILAGVSAGTIVLTVGLLRSKHRKVSP